MGLSNLFGTITRTAGLKEYGLSEKLGGNVKSAQLANQQKLLQKSTGYKAPQSKAPAGQVLSYNAPRSTTTQQSSNSSSGGGGGNLSNYSNQLSSNVQKSKKDNTRAAESSRDAMMSAINDEYSSVMGQLSQQEQALNQQLPLTEQQITQSYGEAVPAIQQEQASRVAGLQAQQGEAEQGTASSISGARRMYNELLSGAQKFQGSAGEAFGELLGRQTASTIGEARQNLTNTVSQIQAELGRVNSFYQTKLTDLERNKGLAIEQARQDFRNEVAKINANKTAASNFKSTQNLNALANFQQMVAQINDAASVAQQSIDMWKAQQEQTLSSARNEAVKSIRFNPVGMDAFGGFVGPQFTPQQGEGSVTTDPKTGQPYIFRDGQWQLVTGNDSDLFKSAFGYLNSEDKKRVGTDADSIESVLSELGL